MEEPNLLSTAMIEDLSGKNLLVARNLDYKPILWSINQEINSLCFGQLFINSQVIGTQILELGTFGHILVTADLILGWSVIILRNLGMNPFFQPSIKKVSQDILGILGAETLSFHSLNRGYEPLGRNCRRTLLTQLTDRFFG